MNNDIQTIDDSGMLNTDQLKSIRSVVSSIDDGFKRRQRFRPRFLMEVGVLNDMKFPTPDAKYAQCNVERDTHFRNLVMLSFDYREKVVDIEILKNEIDEFSGDLPLSSAKKEKKQIQIEREIAILVYMQKEAQERVREIMNWSEIMSELESQLKYDPEDIEAHMPETFAIRYAREQETLQLTRGQSDMSGAMNIVSTAKTIMQHKDVQKLIKEENK